MKVVLQPEARRRLRSELLRYRARYDLADSAYVRDVLKISPNTFKKRIKENDAELIILSRHRPSGRSVRDDQIGLV